MRRLLLLLTLAGCAPANVAPRASEDKTLLETLATGIVDNGVYRFEDPKHGVTCWVYDGLKAGGISCVRTDGGAP